MPDLRLSDKLREFLMTAQGKEVTLNELRQELRINPDDPAWQGIRQQMANLTKEHLVKPSGRKDGIYKVITQVKPVQVFGRERKPPITLHYPKDYDTKMEMPFAEDIILREGDLILISGLSNFGKTTLCMNFCAENLEACPVLMGNEYTTLDREPSPRFMQRIDTIDWVAWTNGSGADRFILLPVFEDYAEHIIPDRINIIDWINIDKDFFYISKVMEEIKRALGKGVGIIAIQKGEGTTAGRGGQFTKDFADVELLLDQYGTHETLLRLGKVKETKHRLTTKAFAFGISQGVKIIGFRELQECKACHGKGWKGIKQCENCSGKGFIDK